MNYWMNEWLQYVILGLAVMQVCFSLFMCPYCDWMQTLQPVQLMICAALSFWRYCSHIPFFAIHFPRAEIFYYSKENLLSCLETYSYCISCSNHTEGTIWSEPNSITTNNLRHGNSCISQCVTFICWHVKLVKSIMSEWRTEVYRSWKGF